MRLILACLLFSRGALDAQCVRGSRAQLDRTRPVPAKADVLDAWQRRQSAIHSFYFAWTELQTQPRGWIANPRYVERERLTAPSLEDRRYVVNKTLAVSRDSMRYSYTLDNYNANGILVVTRGPITLVANLGDGEQKVEVGDRAATPLLVSSPAVEVGDGVVALPPDTVVVLGP